jgi:hypothetical protein
MRFALKYFKIAKISQSVFILSLLSQTNIDNFGGEFYQAKFFIKSIFKFDFLLTS